jgi:hypothetical protein
MEIENTALGTITMDGKTTSTTSAGRRSQDSKVGAGSASLCWDWHLVQHISNTNGERFFCDCRVCD